MSSEYIFKPEVLSYKEAEQRFGITREQIEEWDEACCKGDVPGEPVGKVMRGRPLKFGEGMQLVGFKEPRKMITFMDSRAKDLGMSRSDYLRHLVSEDLKTAGLIAAD